MAGRFGALHGRRISEVPWILRVAEEFLNAALERRYADSIGAVSCARPLVNVIHGYVVGRDGLMHCDRDRRMSTRIPFGITD